MDKQSKNWAGSSVTRRGFVGATAAAAATTGKILALTAPRDNLEKMNADKLKAYSENASDEYAAENFFRHLLAGKLKPVPLPMPANGVGEALLSFADE